MKMIMKMIYDKATIIIFIATWSIITIILILSPQIVKW